MLPSDYSLLTTHYSLGHHAGPLDAAGTNFIATPFMQ
jgi:hypothetical protein